MSGLENVTRGAVRGQVFAQSHQAAGGKPAGTWAKSGADRTTSEGGNEYLATNRMPPCFSID